MRRVATSILALIMIASMSAWVAAQTPPAKEQPAGMIIYDTFSGKNNDAIADRTPDKANAPGGKWTLVSTGMTARILIPDAADQYPVPMALLSCGGDSNGAIAIPISSKGNYTKPKKFTISAEFWGVWGGPRPVLGFYSALPDMKDNKEPADKNFIGLVLTPCGLGPDNGTLDLYLNGKVEKSVKYTGTFVQTELHRLSCDVDTTTGAISNVKLTGSSSDYSVFNTTAFTDAATAYAATGIVFPCGRDATVFVHNFVVGSNVTFPDLPPVPKKPWIPEKPGLLVCFKAPDYNQETAIWKDSSGNGNDAKGGVPEMRPKLIPGATPNGSPAVEASLKGSAFDTWMIFKPVDISTPTGFTIVAYMVQGTFDDNIHREFVSGEAASLSVRPCNGHLQLCTAWSTDIGMNDTAFKPDTWALFGVHGTMGKTATFRFNGADDGTRKMPAFAPYTRTYQFFHVTGGKIAELRIYNKDLSTEELQAVEAEMTASYGAPPASAK